MNELIFKRIGIVDCSVIETRVEHLRRFLGDAHFIAAEHGDGYDVNFYEAADADYCVVIADGECLIHVAHCRKGQRRIMTWSIKTN